MGVASSRAGPKERARLAPARYGTGRAWGRGLAIAPPRRWRAIRTSLPAPGLLPQVTAAVRARFGCSGSSAAMKRRGRGAEEAEEACGVWLDAAALKRRKVQVGTPWAAGECGGRSRFFRGV